MQSVKNKEAVEAFNEKKVRAKKLLKKIQADIAKFGEGEAVNWGHAGSMEHVLELLTELDEFVNGTASREP